MARLPRLGRRGLAAGEVTALASGNSVVTSDVRGAPAAYPGNTDGLNASPHGGVEAITPPSQLGEENYGGEQFQHSRLVARDRHIVSRRGRTTTGAEESHSGVPNPETAGPPRPEYEMVNRTISFQIGTDHTAGLDNDAPHASTDVVSTPSRFRLRGRTKKTRFPLSKQGSTPWEPVYGGTPGLYRPYGARGFVYGPQPSVYSLPGGPQKPNILLSPGAPGDGPQLVSGGMPHGLHSPTVPPTAVTKGRYASVKQMVPGRAQRPAGAKIAGQSY